MRAYVLTEKTSTEGLTLAVTSSRKTAIEGCENIFKQTGPGKIEWLEKNKHTGRVTKNGRVLTYRMFFVKQID